MSNLTDHLQKVTFHHDHNNLFLVIGSIGSWTSLALNQWCLDHNAILQFFVLLVGLFSGLLGLWGYIKSYVSKDKK